MCWDNKDAAFLSECLSLLKLESLALSYLFWWFGWDLLPSLCVFLFSLTTCRISLLVSQWAVTLLQYFLEPLAWVFFLTALILLVVLLAPIPLYSPPSPPWSINAFDVVQDQDSLKSWSTGTGLSKEIGSCSQAVIIPLQCKESWECHVRTAPALPCLYRAQDHFSFSLAGSLAVLDGCSEWIT